MGSGDEDGAGEALGCGRVKGRGRRKEIFCCKAVCKDSFLLL